MTLAELEALGRELARLKWPKHLERVRELYAVTRDGGRAEWSHEHAASIASYLGLGPAPLPERLRGEGCPKCNAIGMEHGVVAARTLASLPDRWVSECTRCGAGWVTLEQQAQVGGGPGDAVRLLLPTPT